MTWDPYCTPPEVTPIARLGQLRKHQAVTHPSTNLATPCLTSVISRELVYPKCYALAPMPLDSPKNVLHRQNLYPQHDTKTEEQQEEQENIFPKI